MLLRREAPDDVDAIRHVHRSAFAPMYEGDAVPPEVGLVDALRADDAWIPELSIVAHDAVGGELVGHVVCHRGQVDGHPVLGLGPLGVRPSHQHAGYGSALMHAVLGAADALHEPCVVLLGHPGYYPRFGFRLASTYGITPPVAEWAPHFQVRTLTAYDPAVQGSFQYAKPFDEL